MRTEQQVYEELLQLESDLECKLHDVKIAIKVLLVLKYTESVPVKSEPIPDQLPKAVREIPPSTAPKSLNDKTCLDCGKIYTPTSNVQKRCEECRSKKVTKSTKPPE